MFTGIVQEIGVVKKIIQGGNKVFINISCRDILKDVNLGDSISVNGVCLTVTEIGSNDFTADVMPETINCTTLKNLSSGIKVNLEPALTLTSRLGGHIVSGHIDSVGKIIKRYNDGNADWFEIEAVASTLRYIVSKGSITLDGTSLTVIDIDDKSFSVSLIPHTRKVSILGDKKVGDYLNIECDILAKYVEKLLNINNKDSDNIVVNKKESITMEFLIEKGFV